MSGADKRVFGKPFKKL